jgi:thiamine biosynthesis lipoprotein
MIKFTKFVLLIVLVLGIFACKKSHQKEQNVYISIDGFTQGTTYSVIYETEDTVNYKDQIQDLLAEIDSSMSTYNDSSVITAINTNQKTKVDSHFKKVFETATKVSQETKGAFDVTVGPLVEAYGFGNAERMELNRKKVDSLLEFVGYKKLSLENNKIIKSDPRIRIDMNAIAQGYTVEVISDFLARQNVKNYLVEVGGEVKTQGINNEGEPWRIGIDKPVEGNYAPGKNLKAIVKMGNKSLATSGNYRKFYEKNGVKYSHTIHPVTGYPVQSKLLSVTVFANDCTRADALATAFMVMGLEKSRDFLSKHNDIGALFIYSDDKGRFQIDYTPNVEKFIVEEY